uniref:DUF3856 domain-containing protein n=1 Tax=Panagrolaimus sp. PS1159 TaxID=55785 RepID=A0AC35FBJ9_9BILA
MAPRTFKKILSAGKGPLHDFEKDTKAIFDYEVLLPLVDVNKEGFPQDKDQYKIIDTTKKPWPHGYGKPLELVFGKKFQLPIMETCLQSMLVDEISQFDIDTRDMISFPMVSAKLRDISKAELHPKLKDEEHHHHHCAAMGPVKTGYDELDDLINNPRPIRLIIHLKKLLKPEDYKVDSWQLNDESKLKQSEILRQEGNELFKNGNFNDAKEKYREALTLLDTLLLKEKPGDPEFIELDAKNIPLYLNLSQCYLNLQNFYEALGSAEEVLKRDAFNEKGLFRKAKAQLGVWDLDAAEKTLNTLKEKHPESVKTVEAQFAIINEKRKEKDKSDKSMYKNMFSALQKDT